MRIIGPFLSFPQQARFSNVLLLAVLCSFEERKLLFVHQFGFCHSMTTSPALLEFCDSPLNNMDRGNVSSVLYLDLKKAFDTENHAMLLKKLTALGVDSDSLLWFKLYLCNRTQRTAVAESTSHPHRITVQLEFRKDQFWVHCFF